MLMDWKPSKVAFIDFETQSECDLTACTTHQFASHPTTRILTCCVKADGVMHRFGPYMTAESMQKLAAIASTHTLVAHNAPFDAAIWDASGLPPAKWFDTLPCARAAGFPGKLDELGKILLGTGKDPNGRRLIDMLCIIRNGKYPVVGPAHKLLLDYNARDVDPLLETVYERVKTFGVPEVMTVDRVINDRGVPIDREFLGRLRELFACNKEVQANVFSVATGGVSPSSPKQIKDWLIKQGFPMQSIGKQHLKEFMENPEEFYSGNDSEFDEAVQLVEEAFHARCRS